MLTVESETIFLFVSAIKDSSGIHSQVVEDQQPHLQDQKLLILVGHHHVESMLNVEKEMEQHPAHVYQDYLVIHMWSVNQNVQSTQNVQQTKHVSIRNVWILVQEFVELMLHVQCRIIIHHVHVIQDTQEILSDTAQELQHCQFLLKLLIHADHLHVVQMLFVIRDKEQPPANVFQTTLVILM